MNIQKELKNVFDNLPIGFVIDITGKGEKTILSKIINGYDYSLLVIDEKAETANVLKLVVEAGKVKIDFFSESEVLKKKELADQLIKRANETPFLKTWLNSKLILLDCGKIVSIDAE